MQPEALPHLSIDALADVLAAPAAVLVVDVQGDFASPDGAMGRRGVPRAPIEAAIDRMETVLEAARDAGALVVFIRVVTRPESDSGALQRLYARKGRPPEAHAICRADGPGVDYYRLRPQPGELEVAKPLFDSFHDTPLETLLKARDVGAVLVMGLTTDCCVDQTARGAFHRDLDVIVVSDATAAYDEALHQSALRALEKNCASLAQAADVASALRARVGARTA